MANIEVEIREFPLAGADLRNGNVRAGTVLRVVWMLVPDRFRAVCAGVIAMAVECLFVQVDAPGVANIAIGIHVHVKTSQLHG